MVLQLAALPLIFGLIATSPVIAYESDKVENPQPETVVTCTAMNYNDYVDGGYGMN